MFSVFVTMLLILAAAAAVALYVAFPRQGRPVPHIPWVGEALERGVSSLPTLDNQLDQRERQDAAH